MQIKLVKFELKEIFHRKKGEFMYDVVMCVMWIVSAIVAITGIVIRKDIDFAIWIMVIPLLVSIFT